MAAVGVLDSALALAVRRGHRRARRPTVATVPRNRGGPVGHRDEHRVSGSYRRTARGEGHRDRRLRARSPARICAPGAAGAPALRRGTAVTRSGPGRKATVAERDRAGHGRPSACCQRSIAASVAQPNVPSAGPGLEPERGQVRCRVLARRVRASCPARTPARPGPRRRAAITAWSASRNSGCPRCTTSPGAGSQVTIAAGRLVDDAVRALVAERAGDSLPRCATSVRTTAATDTRHRRVSRAGCRGRAGPQVPRARDADQRTAGQHPRRRGCGQRTGVTRRRGHSGLRSACTAGRR